MRLFTTKVQLIEAVQWDGDSETYRSLLEDLGDAVVSNDDQTLSVMSPDGAYVARLGDWIVREPSGICFAMDNAVFQTKYAVLPHKAVGTHAHALHRSESALA